MKIPESVVLDTRDTVKKLRALVKSNEPTVDRFFVLQVLEDIVDCVRNPKTFTRELRQLMDDVDNGKYKKIHPVQDGVLSAAIHEVAVTIFDQLKTSGFYLPGVVLPYYFYPVNDPHFHDVLLLRIHELDNTPEQVSPH